MKRYLSASVMLIASVLCVHAREVNVKSPDGHLTLVVGDHKGSLGYSVKFGKTVVVQWSPLSFELEDSVWGDEVSILSVNNTVLTDEYDLPVGKTSHVKSVSNQSELVVVDRKTGLKASLFARAFDDAVAFRYEFKSSGGKDRIVIRNENMELIPAGDPVVTALYVNGYVNSHEGPYTRCAFSSHHEGNLVDMPTLFEFDNCYMAVTEANLVNYAGMYLIRKGERYTTHLSPHPDDPSVCVDLALPARTPWRVFQLADKPGRLIESTVLTTLCDPCRIDDLSWLKPGKTTFPWWNDSCAPDNVTVQWGNNFDTARYYIDFAAENGIDYHSVYGYGDMPWYYDDGPWFGQAGPNADLTRPDSRLDFPRVCRYAQSRGVDIHVWLNWAALWKDIDRVFDKFNEWGVKGMMVDFMDRDDQEMIHIQEEILRKAAEHHLFIQFHGASKPSGLVRTYPNEFTREGTYNYEVYKWDTARLMGADHDINMPFTRLLAGPADYHLGGFRSLAMDKWEVHYHGPYVTSSRCHMLGMYIVMESYLAMVADYPEAYAGQPGFEFLKHIPTNWDDTVIPAAEVSGYVVAARRNGEKWWIGAINNSEARTVDVDTSFLPEGEYVAEGCFDADDSKENPNHLVEKQFGFKSGDVLHLGLASAGGFAFTAVRVPSR